MKEERNRKIKDDEERKREKKQGGKKKRTTEGRETKIGEKGRRFRRR